MYHRFDEFVREALAAQGDDREVVADPEATYFGAQLVEDALVPRGESLRGATTFAQHAERVA